MPWLGEVGSIAWVALRVMVVVRLSAGTVPIHASSIGHDKLKKRATADPLGELGFHRIARFLSFATSTIAR